jgi:hypothetical protein
MKPTITDLPFDQNLEGYVSGSEISIIQEYTDRAGSGPRLHQHPYSETFIVRRGAAHFWAGDEELVVSGGQVLVVPKLTPPAGSGTRRPSTVRSRPCPAAGIRRPR